MKIQKNKKYYNFTEKQKRSDFNKTRRGYNPPRSFIRPYNVKFRRQCKDSLLKNISLDLFNNYPIYEYPTIRRSATYDYW